MDAKELAALGNGMVHMIRALSHNEQLGLLLALNEAVLSRHEAGCAALVIEDLCRVMNDLQPPPPEIDPLKIN